jgi:uncharacterized protein
VESTEGREPPLYEVGCVGEIVGLEELEDGRFNIILNGSNRFRLIEEVDSTRPIATRTISTSARSTTASRRRCRWRSDAEVEREARRLGERLAFRSIGLRSAGSTTRCWSTQSPRSRRFDVSAKQALARGGDLAGRADLLVQLMQFLRLSQGGAELQPTLQ